MLILYAGVYSYVEYKMLEKLMDLVMQQILFGTSSNNLVTDEKTTFLVSLIDIYISIAFVPQQDQFQQALLNL